MKIRTKTKMNMLIASLFIISCLIATFCNAETALHEMVSLLEQFEHEHGLYALEILKKLLGTLTIIGAFGFFITTSSRRAHWPPYIRRIFFSLFIFCNIINQTIFNVVNVPSSKKLLRMLGRCTTKITGATPNFVKET